MSDLAAVVSGLEIDADGEAIADAIRVRDLLEARIAKAVGEYDAQCRAALDGAASTIGWLKAAARMSGGAAGSIVKTARKLRHLPVTQAAWLDGSLSSNQVQAVCANVSASTIDQLAAQEGELVPLLRPLTVHDLSSVMRHWKANADLLNGDTPPSEHEREAYLSELLDGRGRLDVDLDAEGTQLARAALRLAETPDSAGEERTAAQRRGDAIVDIFRYFLDHQGHVPKNRNRPHVSFVVDWSRFEAGHGGAFADGTPVSPATIRRVLCDAGVSRVVTDGRSTILDYGTTKYLFSDSQFQAIVLRDRHCRHAGCDRPPWWCEVHHVLPFPNGPTSITNGVLKCSRHHHIGHQPGWTEALEPDGTYHLTAPDGRTWTTTPPGVLTNLAEVA
jgi:hypothetical protein